MKKREIKNNKLDVRKFFSKRMIVYYIILLVDIGLVIYCASRNVLNYAKINGERMLIGSDKNKFFGRNNVTIVITLFIYLYICLLNKLFFKEKREVLFYIIWLLLLLLVNSILFFVFSIRIY